MRSPPPFCSSMHFRFPIRLPDMRLIRGAIRLATVIALWGAIAGGCRGAPRGAPVRVIIPEGATFRQATDSLARHGVIGSPRGFRLYAKIRGRDRSIQPGTYLLQRGAGWGEVLTALILGRGIVHTVRIPEGLMLSQIAAILGKELKVVPESIAAVVRDTALRRRLDVPTPVIEGYLFPDTYQFPDGTSARDAVNRMVDRFETAWKPEWDERLRALAMTRHDVLTLASIVEKEARLAEERPIIAAVYLNRLRIGMALQADPTVQYALGRFGERVLYRDLEVKSDYNTYRNRGLPPGPICSPGIASIEAALFPADVPYIYFVAHPDGHHEFRRTFKEHLEARRLIRQRSGRRARAAPR